MTNEQIAEMLGHDIKSLEYVTWWECKGCPVQKECFAEDCSSDDYKPMCERAIIEARDIIKELAEQMAIKLQGGCE